MDRRRDRIRRRGRERRGERILRLSRGRAVAAAASGAGAGAGIRRGAERLGATRDLDGAAVRRHGGLDGDGGLGRRALVDQLGDAEVEQLRQQPARARGDHHVRRLQVAVDDAVLVHAVHDLGEALEERHHLVDRQRALVRDPPVERRAAHELHRDPHDAVGLGAERVDVRGVRMVEPRRQPRLAQEALDRDVARAQPAVQDLDDGLAAEQRLLGAIDRAEPAFADALAQDELSQRPARKLVWLHRLRLYRV